MAEYDELVKRLKYELTPERYEEIMKKGWDVPIGQMIKTVKDGRPLSDYYRLIAESWMMEGKNELISEAAAAIQALQQQGQWQDISTAPKDGTTFLAYNSFSGVYTTCFTTMWVDGSPDYEGFPCGFVNGMFGAWDVQPSHWQPIPPPPTT